jgi:hypothetical protein
MPWCRVNNKSGWFISDQEIFVFINNIYGNRFGRECDLFGGRNHHFNLILHPHPVARTRGTEVH